MSRRSLRLEEYEVLARLGEPFAIFLVREQHDCRPPHGFLCWREEVGRWRVEMVLGHVGDRRERELRQGFEVLEAARPAGRVYGPDYVRGEYIAAFDGGTRRRYSSIYNGGSLTADSFGRISVARRGR